MTAKTKKQVEPKRFEKSELTVTHDLYKCDVSTMVKNVHYKKYEHRFEEFEHCHFFHSVNNRGKPQTHCNAVGGHTHKIETWVDEDGTLKGKCGPPIHKVWKQGKGGAGKYVWEPITFENQWGEVVRTDDHTHEVTYKGSEDITVGQTTMNGAQAMASYAQASAMAKLEQSAAMGAKLATDITK